LLPSHDREEEEGVDSFYRFLERRKKKKGSYRKSLGRGRYSLAGGARAYRTGRKGRGGDGRKKG